eukprot:sb/3477642/
MSGILKFIQVLGEPLPSKMRPSRAPNLQTVPYPKERSPCPKERCPYPKERSLIQKKGALIEKKGLLIQKKGGLSKSKVVLLDKGPFFWISDIYTWCDPHTYVWGSH